MSDEEGRYYGFLVGVITSVDDPKSIGRVQARIGAMDDGESSGWLLPLWPGGIESTPNVKDTILVGFLDGDPNRGFYGMAPRTTTKDRAAEPLILGAVAWGMINNLVTQFNQLRTDFHTFVTTTYNTHNHASAPVGPVSVPSAVGTGTSATAAQKGKGADGSEVPAKTSSEVVLSKVSKTR